MQRVLTRARETCPRAIPVVGLVLAAAAAIWPTWPPLLESWRVMRDYTYGNLLAPFVVGWIAVRSIDLPRPAERISLLASVALTAFLAAWLVAFKASSAIGEQLMTPLILWTASWVAFGLPIARRLAVPLAYLYFAIPVWEFLVPVLQSSAVWVVETVFGWIGVPVHIDGDLVSIPEGTFRIAEACAGRRYFVVCLVVTAVFAGIARLRPLRTAAFLAIAAALAVVTNWIRVLTVIYAGHVTDMTSYLVAHEHLSFGWALFVVLMVGVFLIGRRLTREGTLPPWPAEPGACVAPGTRELVMRPAFPATLLLLLIPVLAVSYSLRGLRDAPALGGETALLTLPPATGIWSGPHPSTLKWRPRYPGAAAVARASYASSQGSVEIFVAEYDRELRGAKLVSSANTLFPSDWTVLGRGALAAVGENGLSVRARMVSAETPAGERWVISYLYRLHHFVTANAVAIQLAYGILAWGEPVRSHIVAVAARCRPSCSAAQERVESFWSSVAPSLLGVHR